MDDQLVSERLRRCVGACDKLIGDLHRGVRARQLVAVNAVGKPRDRRKPFGNPLGLLWSAELARIGKFRVVGLDRFQSGVIVGTGDRQVVQRAAFMRLGVGRQTGELRSVGQGVQVAHKVVVADGGPAHGVSDHRLRRGSIRVEGGGIDKRFQRLVGGSVLDRLVFSGVHAAGRHQHGHGDDSGSELTGATTPAVVLAHSTNPPYADQLHAPLYIAARRWEI